MNIPASGHLRRDFDAFGNFLEALIQKRMNAWTNAERNAFANAKV
jgi:hypothetical protein